MKRLFTLILLFPVLLSAASTLDIYWIDVEGGAATLLVTQAGETVLMDTGFPGRNDRDARRIESVLKREAKASKIDYLLISHYHGDHVGGLAALVKRVPVGQFIDHGQNYEPDMPRTQRNYENYLKIAEGKRRQVGPGDTIPLKGIDFQIVASASQFPAKPLVGDGYNPLCKNVEVRPEVEPENGKSIGFLVRIGEFEFLDLGDLSWNWEYQMACPVNLLGEIDLYQVTHHGMNMSGHPAHLGAIKPKVAVMNNGATKGGSAETFAALAELPDLQDLWQVHRAIKVDDASNTDQQLIANLGETEGCEGHWIKASVNGDGSYSITNSRNGFSKTYQVQ